MILLPVAPICPPPTQLAWPTTPVPRSFAPTSRRTRYPLWCASVRSHRIALDRAATKRARKNAARLAGRSL